MCVCKSGVDDGVSVKPGELLPRSFRCLELSLLALDAIYDFRHGTCKKKKAVDLGKHPNQRPLHR